MNDSIVFAERHFTKIIGNERVVLTFSLDATVKTQSADFSIVGDVYSKYAGRNTSPRICGQVQGDYEKHFRLVRRYNKWHLCFVDTGPMHYVANTRFWLEKGIRGGDTSTYASETHKTAEGCYRAAEHCCVWGALDGEIEGQMHLQVPYAALVSTLEARKPALMQLFLSEMVALFGEEPVQRALDHAASLQKVKV
jgi:hypothetical protein